MTDMGFDTTTWTQDSKSKATNDVTTTTSQTLSGTLTAGYVKLSNNVLQASDGGNAITLDTSDNVSIAGDLTVAGGKLTFGNGELITNETDNYISIQTADDAHLPFSIIGTSSYDTSIRFYEGVVLRWSMGQDASDDTNHVLSWDYNNPTVGGAGQQMSLSSSGDLTIAGDLAISGGNITSALTTDALLTATLGVKLGNNIIYNSEGTATLTLDTDEDLTIAGDLTVTGNEITFGNGESIVNTSDDVLSIICSNDTDGLGQFTSAGDTELRIKTGATDKDAHITFFDLSSARWSVGNDGSDSDKFKIDATAAVGGATKLTLDSSGNMTLLGQFACNGASPAAAPDWTVTSHSTDRSFNADSLSAGELADVVGTLITDLIAIGILQ